MALVKALIYTLSFTRPAALNDKGWVPMGWVIIGYCKFVSGARVAFASRGRSGPARPVLCPFDQRPFCPSGQTRLWVSSARQPVRRGLETFQPPSGTSANHRCRLDQSNTGKRSTHLFRSRLPGRAAGKWVYCPGFCEKIRKRFSGLWRHSDQYT